MASTVPTRRCEILVLPRRHFDGDCREVLIEQRLCWGDIDTPKTASQLREWMEVVGRQPDAWDVASENPDKPMWRDNLWRRHMKPNFGTVGMERANSQVLRRTYASVGHDAGIDPKAAPDQHGYPWRH